MSNIPRILFKISVFLFTKLFYRVRVDGLEHVPREGGVLYICNHVSYVDAVILSVVSPRPVRFLSFAGFQNIWWMRGPLRLAGAIPVSPNNARKALEAAVDAIKAGEVVCVFPEGALSRTGHLHEIKKGFEWIARRSDAVVVPVVFDMLWGSIFSYFGNRYFFKRPRRLPYPIAVRFGEPMQDISVSQARRAFLDLSEQAFQQRPELKGHLAAASFAQLAKWPGRELIVDRTLERKSMSAGMLLALSLQLSRKLKARVKEKRVGIVLPPGMGGYLANLCVVLADKVPVNLNFTVGRAAMQASLKRAGAETIISAEPVKKKFPDFPWVEGWFDIADEIKALSKVKIIFTLLAIRCFPTRWLLRWFRIPREGDRREAGLLFTSGSSGEPKGVILTHRNILGNILQVEDCGVLRRDDVLLACLPTFHSFGFTVTIWYPLLTGMKAVTVPSPLEIKKVAKVIQEERCTMLLGTPTFLKPYLRKIEPVQLESLRAVIAGAEKTPAGFAEAWEERFGGRYLEGYGLTETSPVVSVNLPDPSTPNTGTAEPQVASRLGSTGRLFLGMSARICDPDTGDERGLFETGMLQLRGPNIFGGYLYDEVRTREVFQEDWFVTGDLARFDEDGFLYIEGRLSRFSKLAGEMVPHGTIEQAIIKAFGLEGADTPVVMVTARPDPAKGEALVVLTTESDITAAAIQVKLSHAGIANLWIPKIVKEVEGIPCLPTGKLDLKQCQTLAQE